MKRGVSEMGWIFLNWFIFHHVTHMTEPKNANSVYRVWEEAKKRPQLPQQFAQAHNYLPLQNQSQVYLMLLDPKINRAIELGGGVKACV